jgi:hypothetical protein
LNYPLNTNEAFGTSVYNSGRRVLEVAIRYSF